MSVYQFKEQKKIKTTPEIEKLPTVKHEEVEDINNTDKYNWVQVGDTKYGRCMYCTKTKIKRTNTMGEFYGTSTVD